MRNHRTTPQRHFTPLRNSLLRDPRLSLTARGLLADLLSRPDGDQVDIKGLSAQYPDSQAKIAKAYAELVKYGYVVRRRVKDAESSRIRTEVHVYDIPQASSSNDDLSLVIPSLSFPSLEDPSPLLSEEKNGENNPPYPLPEPVAAPVVAQEPGGRLDDLIEEETPQADACAEVLVSLGQKYPQLRLGRREMIPLLPLVAEWFRLGQSVPEIHRALAEGLPLQIHSAKSLLRHRLAEKLPYPSLGTTTSTAPAAKRPECPECARPGDVAGLCLTCSGIAPAPVVELSSAGELARAAVREKALAAQKALADRAKYAHAN